MEGPIISRGSRRPCLSGGSTPGITAAGWSAVNPCGRKRPARTHARTFREDERAQATRGKSGHARTEGGGGALDYFGGEMRVASKNDGRAINLRHQWRGFFGDGVILKGVITEKKFYKTWKDPLKLPNF